MSSSTNDACAKHSKNKKKSTDRSRLNLGKEFNNQYLTQREIDVLKYVILGHTAKKIALSLNVSARTIETYIEILKLKLNCNRKGDLIEKSIRLGLIQLFNFDCEGKTHDYTN